MHAQIARYSQNTTSFYHIIIHHIICHINISDHWTTRRSWSLVSDDTRLVCGQINGMKNLPDTVIVSPIRVTFAVALVVDWAAPSPRATQHVLHQLEEQTVASEAQLTRVRHKLQQIKDALKKYTKSEKDYSPESIERRLQWHFYGKNPPRILTVKQQAKEGELLSASSASTALDMDAEISGMDFDEAGDMSLLGDPSTPMGGTVGAMGGTDLDSVLQDLATTMMPTFNSSELGWLQAPDVGSAVLAIGQRVFVDEGTMEGVSGRRAEGFFGVITWHHDNGDYGVWSQTVRWEGAGAEGKTRERRVPRYAVQKQTVASLIGPHAQRARHQASSEQRKEVVAARKGKASAEREVTQLKEQKKQLAKERTAAVGKIGSLEVERHGLLTMDTMVTRAP